MRIQLTMLAGPVLAVLAGCDGGGEPRKPAQKIAVRSEAQIRLHQLDELNRAIGLKRAILASGFSCKRVTSSGYVQEHGNLSMWMASCDDKRDWAIFVGPDGSAQVRPCQDMADLKLPQCVMRGAGKEQQAR